MHQRDDVRYLGQRLLGAVVEVLAVVGVRGRDDGFHLGEAGIEGPPGAPQVGRERGITDCGVLGDARPHLVRVGHLRDRFGPHERDGLDPADPGGRQLVDQRDLRGGRHRVLVLQPIPGADFAQRDPRGQITHGRLLAVPSRPGSLARPVR